MVPQCSVSGKQSYNLLDLYYIFTIMRSDIHTVEVLDGNKRLEFRGFPFHGKSEGMQRGDASTGYTNRHLEVWKQKK